MACEDERPEIPSVLQRLSTEEYTPAPYAEVDRRAIDQVRRMGTDDAHRLDRPLGDYWKSRLGTAAALRAVNESIGVECFVVPPEAALEQAAADEAFGAAPFVVDVQTHYLADRPELQPRFADQVGFMQTVKPEWWSGLDELTSYSFAEYLRCVFLESDTAVAVLTAPPADELGGRFLTNDELVGTRALIDRLAGTGRLLNHTVVQPSLPGETEHMERWLGAFDPVGWKVYTMGGLKAPGAHDTFFDPSTAWMLDDETMGLPFLEEVRRLGGLNVCSHKGISALADNGSPRDIGPCARMFPDINFIVYHAGFESDADNEGPYTEATAHDSINRLITSMRENGIGPGANVYAELGATWFMLIRRPVQAAHALGKLLLAVGEDNILWGTDSCYYGPTLPLEDALRSFRIPDELCERYGYPQLTDEIKAKILGLNAARVYGIDPVAAMERYRHDDLAWTKAALEDYRARGVA